VSKARKRKITLSLDADALAAAREFDLDVSSIVDAALQRAVADAYRGRKERAQAADAEAERHAKQGRP
jgi:antitoxin CcdA